MNLATVMSTVWSAGSTIAIRTAFILRGPVPRTAWRRVVFFFFEIGSALRKLSGPIGGTDRLSYRGPVLYRFRTFLMLGHVI